MLGWILIIILIPSAVELLLLTFGALIPAGRQIQREPLPGKWAVAIPAHNEEKHIGGLLDALRQIDGTFDIFVIADNCNDGTADIASKRHAHVLVRNDPNHSGKGFALNYGIKKILEKDYAWIAILDADAMPSKDFITAMQAKASDGCSAVQLFYGIDPNAISWRQKIMRIAFYCFNYLRPRGRSRLGFSAGIFGQGFALHRSVLESVPFTSHALVEDLWYHWDLVAKREKVHFCETGYVYASAPAKGKGVATQRARWEGGRLFAIRSLMPLTIKKVFTGEWRFIEPLLDFLTLPLAYYLLLTLLLAPLAPWASLLFFSAALVHVLAAIAMKGSSKDLITLLYAPFYLVWKLTTLFSTIRTAKKNNAWIRTDRSEE